MLIDVSNISFPNAWYEPAINGIVVETSQALNSDKCQMIQTTSYTYTNQIQQKLSEKI